MTVKSYCDTYWGWNVRKLEDFVAKSISSLQHCMSLWHDIIRPTSFLSNLYHTFLAIFAEGDCPRTDQLLRHWLKNFGIIHNVVCCWNSKFHFPIRVIASETSLILRIESNWFRNVWKDHFWWKPGRGIFTPFFLKNKSGVHVLKFWKGIKICSSHVLSYLPVRRM